MYIRLGKVIFNNISAIMWWSVFCLSDCCLTPKEQATVITETTQQSLYHVKLYRVHLVVDV